MERYTAKVYFDKKEVSTKSGNDLEQLHVWMLTQTNGNPGDVHGEIFDNKHHKIVRKFRKSSLE